MAQFKPGDQVRVLECPMPEFIGTTATVREVGERMGKPAYLLKLGRAAQTFVALEHQLEAA